jgi:hypothetical protein
LDSHANWQSAPLQKFTAGHANLASSLLAVEFPE